MSITEYLLVTGLIVFAGVFVLQVVYIRSLRDLISKNVPFDPESKEHSHALKKALKNHFIIPEELDEKVKMLDNKISLLDEYTKSFVNRSVSRNYRESKKEEDELLKEKIFGDTPELPFAPHEVDNTRRNGRPRGRRLKRKNT